MFVDESLNDLPQFSPELRPGQSWTAVDNLTEILPCRSLSLLPRLYQEGPRPTGIKVNAGLCWLHLPSFSLELGVAHLNMTADI